MEKRVLAAIGLSIAILFGFRYIQERRMAELVPQMPIPQTSQAPAAGPIETAPAEPQPEPEPAPNPEDTAAEAQSVVVQGDLYRAVLDNRGAVLTSWQLNEYKAADGSSSK